MQVEADAGDYLKTVRRLAGGRLRYVAFKRSLRGGILYDARDDKVVPAEMVMTPVLRLPPKPRRNVPACTSRTPTLERKGPKAATPVPADFLRVPSLRNLPLAEVMLRSERISKSAPARLWISAPSFTSR